MYKIGICYKRQEVFRDQLLEEIKESNVEAIKKVKADLSSMNELIQQVHDELSDQSKNLATFKESMIREVNDSRDQTLIASTMLNRWKAEFDNLALVQACTSEFMSMQTTLDNVYLQSLK